MLKKAGVSAELPRDITPGSLIIIDVPSAGWVSPTGSASPAALLGITDEQEIKRQKRGRTALLKREFAIYERTENSFDKAETRFIEEIASDIRFRTTCIIVSCDIDRLIPAAIRSAADYVVILPALDAALLSQILERVTGTAPSQPWPELKLNSLSPEQFRLAYRDGESADRYLNRLARAMITLPPKPPIPPKKPKIKLNELHGMAEVIDWAKRLAVDMSAYRAGTIKWADIDPGLLLVGPPGTGKTTAAAAIADFCDLAFISTSYANWQSSSEGHLGDVIRAIKASFNEARSKAPSLLFIDELDSISSRERGSGYREWWTSIVNCILEELDGTNQREGVIVLGATNHPEKIDNAIKRAGRLDREIRINLPHQDDIIGILRNHLGSALSEDELDRIAGLSVGGTGADIEQLVRGAKRRARAAHRDINFDDMLNELTGGSRPTGSKQDLRSAIHEAGHAVAMTIVNPALTPSVNIARNGKQRGQALVVLDEDEPVTAAAIDDILLIALAGRAAEEIFYGAASAGAGGTDRSDLALATKFATHAELALGLGSCGIVWSHLDADTDLAIARSMRPGAEQAVSNRLDIAYEKAKILISENQSLVLAIAEALIDYVMLTPKDIKEIIILDRSKQAANTVMH
ncbi:MAG TPA: AAA family ATPase [Acidocella sp.]|nr:AAA family ATPase [Acidocella sp.]